MDLIIKNGTVVTATEMFKADIAVNGGKIAALGSDLSDMKADKVVDAEGKLVLPGAIDAHTHLAMPFGGTISSDDYFAGTRAAACGGTTTVFDFALQNFDETMPDTFKRRNALAAPDAAVDYSFHIGVKDIHGELLDSIGEACDMGITSYKVFMVYDFGVKDGVFYEYYFETHIEQGPILEDNGNDIGVVDCVLGMFNYRLRFYGQTTHAGTFPMPKRRDAFLAASEALCYLHEEIDKLGYKDLVYTTGEVVCHPCVHTCVPDFFDFSFDSRHEDPKVLEKVLAIVKSCADKTWAGCTCEVVKAWNRDTVYWDKKLVGYVKQSCEELGIKHQYIHSGAGHDAQFAAYMLPTTMIFVQSKDGLSHCEPEFSSVEHCTEGASVMLNAVLKADAE